MFNSTPLERRDVQESEYIELGSFTDVVQRGKDEDVV